MTAFGRKADVQLRFSTIETSMTANGQKRTLDLAADAKGRQRLARYMIHCPFVLEKMRYDQKSGMVICCSMLHAILKRNYQLMPALKWLRMLMNHISLRRPRSARAQRRDPAADLSPRTGKRLTHHPAVPFGLIMAKSRMADLVFTASHLKHRDQTGTLARCSK